MNFSSINKYINKSSNSVVNIVFLLYSVFLALFVSVYIFILHKDPVFFITDDGYYVYAKLFWEGKFSLLHAGRGPGIPLLFSWFNIFPDSFHPFLRLAVTSCFVYLNIFLAVKIFEKYLNRSELFVGLLIAVFNPVHIHFTIKNTPEEFMLTFLLILILLYMKLAENPLWITVFYIALAAGISIFIKPVLFLLPVLMLAYVIIFRLKKIFFKASVTALLTLVIFVLFLNLTSVPKETYQGVSYGGLNFIGPTFIPRAMVKTGRFSLDANEESVQKLDEKTVTGLAYKYYFDWMNVYMAANPEAKETKVIGDFIKDNFGDFVSSKLLNLLFFTSLASSIPESFFNLFFNGFILLISFFAMKKFFKAKRNEIYIILFSAAGYASTYLLTFGYARYSIPFLFVISVFSGLFAVKILQGSTQEEKEQK